MTAATPSLFGALDMLVFERRPDGRFARASPLPEWYRALGRGEGDAADVAPEDAFPFLDVFLREAREKLGASASGRVDSEFWTETSSGGDEVHLRAASVRAEGKDLLVVSRDDASFREQRLILQRARDLKRAHSALARELEQRDVLVHCIVHDLATPLNGMLATLDRLRVRAHDAGEARLVEVALDAARRQRDMIRTILYVFSAEAGALAAELDAVTESSDAAETVDRVARELEPLAQSRGVRLEVVHAGDLEAGTRVVGDEERLHRVVANLVENALGAGPPGSSVRVTVEPRAGDVLVAVDDDGPGVRAELVPQLFQKFGRGEGGGTGLGLYFCRITVERWGGSVGYEARPSGGARFYARLRRR